jgi:hypothetical protein
VTPVLSGAVGALAAPAAVAVSIVLLRALPTILRRRPTRR